MDEMEKRVAAVLGGVDEPHALTSSCIATQLKADHRHVLDALRALWDIGVVWTDDRWGWYAGPNAERGDR
jgi:hypothetical protein